MSQAQRSYVYQSETEMARLEQQADAMFAQEEAFLRAAGLRPTDRAVDAGCGPGFISRRLARLVPEGRVDGFDFDPHLIQQAKGRCKDLTNVTIHEASLYALPADTASKDFVYSRFVFSHLAEPAKALQEFARVLAPGGTVALLDVDDGLLASHPPLTEFHRVVDEARVRQEASGGDRSVGRKLAGYLAAAGFTGVQCEMRVIPVANPLTVGLFDIYVDGRLDYVSPSTRDAFEKARPRMREALAAGKAWLYVPLALAFARAPEKRRE